VYATFQRGGGRTSGTAAEQEFEALYQQQYVPLVRASIAITLDLEVAREITHEAFMRLWERRNRLTAGSNEKAWLMRVVVNLAISHRRGLLARLRHRVPEPLAPDPSSVAISRIEGQRMRAALLTLQARERAVLALRYDRDLSFAEIGSILDRPDATVRTICHRAVQKLRQRLSESAVDQPGEKQQNSDLTVKL
jgi:RNA polymerase sigma-70 factor, ECF subfamily